jgi:hypothetical protein
MERRLNSQCKGLLEASGTCELDAPSDDEVPYDFDLDLSATNLSDSPSSLEPEHLPESPYYKSLRLPAWKTSNTLEHYAGEGHGTNGGHSTDEQPVLSEALRTDEANVTNETDVVVRTQGLVPSRRRLPSGSPGFRQNVQMVDHAAPEPLRSILQCKINYPNSLSGQLHLLTLLYPNRRVSKGVGPKTLHHTRKPNVKYLLRCKIETTTHSHIHTKSTISHCDNKTPYQRVKIVLRAK